MSDKALLVMDMPKCCDTCIFSSISSDNELFEDGECYCILKRKSVDDIKEGFKPDWCPLKPIPKKASREKILRMDVFDDCAAQGWNACIDKILEGFIMDNRMKVQEEIRSIKSEMVGSRYRHFKGGIYIVTDIAVHSETEEPMVIYKSFNQPDLVWCRPLSMFVSEVDHEKYPNVKQIMRFERISSDIQLERKIK